jgi:hypothetical protein
MNEQGGLGDYLEQSIKSGIQNTSGGQKNRGDSLASAKELKHMEGMDSFTAYVYLQTDRLAELLIKKQRDYGPKNISQSPGGPINGLRVRMFDKLARINNLYETGATPENESLRDSFMDLANYGIIAMMVLDGQWEGVTNE